jgi:CheY-like chemotaxis protein
MRILIAEDEEGIADLYKISFEDRNHQVVITHDGLECLDAYYKELENAKKDTNNSNNNNGKNKNGIDKGQTTATYSRTPFDAVILDYRMPKKDGMEVAREILAIMPKQRIIFISAYVMQTLEESVKTLRQIVELIQKPVELDTIINRVEDTEIWSGLQKLNVNVKEVKRMNLNHSELTDLYNGLKKLQRNIGI